VFLSDEAATDVELNADDNNLTLTFNYDTGYLIGATGAGVEVWSLDVESRTGSIKLDGVDAENAFSLTLAPPGFDDYVTLSSYDLSASELTRLDDGLLSVELFSPAPGGGGDSIAFDFVRLVVIGATSADCNANGIPDECEVEVEIDYLPAVTYPTGQGGTLGPSLAAADYDGDGLPDVAAGNRGTSPGAESDVIVFLNSGGGILSAPVSYIAGGQPSSITWGDFDADGDADLAVANSSHQGAAAGVGILLNNGDGTFGAVMTIPLGTDPRGLTARSLTRYGLPIPLDVNGDGFVDIAVADTLANTVWVVVNEGKDLFGAWLGYQPAIGYDADSGTFSIAAGDLDGDSDADLATVNQNASTVTVLLNAGDGTFGSRRDTAVGRTPRNLAIADLDEDQWLDIITGDTAALTPQPQMPSVTLLRNLGFTSPGVLEFDLVMSIPYGSQFEPAVGAGDMDLDGFSDVLVAASEPVTGSSVAIFRNVTVEGSGTFSLESPVAFTIDAGPESVTAVDMDGDSDLDLVSGNELPVVNSVSVLINQTMPTLQDCNANGIPDECEPDCNGNGIPDDCDLLPPGLPPDAEHQARKHRYVSIDVTANCANEIGWKVELVELRRCAGDVDCACTEDSDCDNGATGPCVPMPSVLPVEVTWWVQQPQQDEISCRLRCDSGVGPFCNGDADCGGAAGSCAKRCGPTDYFARLDAAPLFGDDTVWSMDTLHVGDCEVIPVATYEIRACEPPDGTVCGDPLRIGTVSQSFSAPTSRARFGDVAGAPQAAGDPFNPPDGFTNVTDLQALQSCLVNFPGTGLPQIHVTWADLHGNGGGTPPNYLCNVGDVQMFLQAFGLNACWKDAHADNRDPDEPLVYRSVTRSAAVVFAPFHVECFATTAAELAPMARFAIFAPMASVAILAPTSNPS